jgi:hypothetical protein
MAGESGITIDREERDGLYELVRNHLGSIEDFWVALERTKDFAVAERMGTEFAEDFRLLQDIGWSEHEARETYVLTMPAPELRKLLWRLRDEAAQVLIEHGGEVESRRRDAETNRRFQIGHQTCEKASGNLDAPAANDWPQRRGQSGRRQDAAVRRARPHPALRRGMATGGVD